jgi:1,6-anhydro-N-acetylmuramate kinase
MPQIMVTADARDRDQDPVMLRERINVADFESEQFAANLMERLGWAVLDAAEAETEPASPARV